MKCPLCLDESPVFYHKDSRREYLQCLRCRLVFVPAQYILSVEQEKAEYDLHQNNENDLGYRKFLSRLLNPMCQLLLPGSKGLDFGCGPGPTLSKMFAELGYQMDIYDPFYFDNDGVFVNKYDFITASEVIEHVRQPHTVLPVLLNMLKMDGLLGIMTKLVLGREEFSCWHYKNDRTHICFYSVDTFSFLEKNYSIEVKSVDNDVIIFKKTASNRG
ncbi:MAG: class I SAM-dependent methyltransferase [Gammaproteobacteria bacterium]|nr:MAG: class I SAM-dependent methyltransferase [Gammaproteobacteria bacterium]